MKLYILDKTVIILDTPSAYRDLLLHYECIELGGGMYAGHITNLDYIAYIAAMVELL